MDMMTLSLMMNRMTIDSTERDSTSKVKKLGLSISLSKLLFKGVSSIGLIMSIENMEYYWPIFIVECYFTRIMAGVLYFPFPDLLTKNQSIPIFSCSISHFR